MTTPIFHNVQHAGMKNYFKCVGKTAQILFSNYDIICSSHTYHIKCMSLSNKSNSYYSNKNNIISIETTTSIIETRIFLSQKPQRFVVFEYEYVLSYYLFQYANKYIIIQQRQRRPLFRK